MALPWQDFPQAVGSFPEPSPVITTEPDDPATRWVVAFSSDYLQMILGALTQLMLQTTWDTDYDGLFAMRQRITALQELLNTPVTVIEGVRQNPVDTCKLEFTTDGTTWTEFANLQACAPVIRRTAAGVYQPGYQLPDGTFDYFDVADGPAATDLWDGYQPTVAMTANTNDRCTAAGNAANVIKQLYTQVGNNLVANTVSAATAFIEAGGTVLATIFGAVIGPEFLATVVPALYAVQAAYAWSAMSDKDFNDLACIFYHNITGSAGNWVSNTAGITAAVNAKAAANPVPWLLIRELLVFIAPQGVDLALKTTQLSTYNCAAGAAYTLEVTLPVRQYVNGAGVRAQSLTGALKAQWAFTRWKLDSQGWTGGGIGNDGMPATIAGYIDASKPASAILLNTTNPDLWWYNGALFGTPAAATAAVRLALNNPTFTPTWVGTLGNIPAGQSIEVKSNSAAPTAAGWGSWHYDIYTVVNYPGC